MSAPTTDQRPAVTVTVARRDDGGDEVRVTLTHDAGPHTNETLVAEVAAAMRALDLTGGRLLRVTGAMSLPMAFAVAHATAHLYGAVAVHDPKLLADVVAISHDPALPVGRLLR